MSPQTDPTIAKPRPLLRRPRAVTTAAIVITASVLTITGIGLARIRDLEAHRAATLLAIDPTFLDFGEVWAQRDFHWTVPIFNSSTRTIHVTRFVASCNCTRVSPPSLAIPAGSTKAVTLQIELAADDRAQRKPWTTFSVQLIPVLDEPVNSTEWRVTGKVKHALAISQSYIDLGAFLPGRDASRMHTCYITPIREVGGIAAVYDPSVLRVDLTPQRGGAGRIQMDVSFNPSAPPKSYTLDVNITARTPTGRLTYGPPITVHGTVLRRVATSPEVIHFGACRQGTTVAQDLVVYTRDETPVKVLRVDASADGLVVNDNGGEGTRHFLRVVQQVTHLGHRRNDFHVFVGGIDPPNNKLMVRTSYVGISQE